MKMILPAARWDGTSRQMLHVLARCVRAVAVEATSAQARRPGLVAATSATRGSAAGSGCGLKLERDDCGGGQHLGGDNPAELAATVPRASKPPLLRSLPALLPPALYNRTE